MHFRLLYFSTVSTEKTFELLVELWNDETNQEHPFDVSKSGGVPLSPGMTATQWARKFKKVQAKKTREIK